MSHHGVWRLLLVISQGSQLPFLAIPSSACTAAASSSSRFVSLAPAAHTATTVILLKQTTDLVSGYCPSCTCSGCQLLHAAYPASSRAISHVCFLCWSPTSRSYHLRPSEANS